MTVLYLPTGDSDADIRHFENSPESAAALVRQLRHKIAIALVGLSFVATVVWVGALGWATGRLLHLW
jgi:hypothetical protein